MADPSVAAPPGDKDPRDKGRASRASSTSSLGREVRCGCQFYRSDSLLPERRALVGRPASRNAVRTPPPPTEPPTPPTSLSENEYEPVGMPRRAPSAPVVRIRETEEAARLDDSDEELGPRGAELFILDGDVVVPLDGRIEDSVMQARELGANGDTSEEQETAQQLQDRLEERFLDAATPRTGSRTDAEINTSQVDSSALEELPLRRGARGLPQKLRNQAGKLRSRLRSIQRPKFSLGRERQKTEKVKQQTKPDKSTTAATNITTTTTTTTTKKSERPRFSLPERPRFSFPDRAKFAMPERPRLNIKRPNLSLPSLGRAKKPLKDRQSTGESNTGSKRNIFDVSTYPRLFDKRSKSRGDYATSSPIASRGQSPETATVPRVKKKPPVGAGWVQRFSDIRYADDEPEGAVERSKPWRRPSLEEPRVSSRSGGNAESAGRIPWEESDETYDARYPTTEFEEADSREDAAPADAEGTERNEDSEGATPEGRRTTGGPPPPLPGEGPGAPPPPRAPEEDSSEATGLPREDWAPEYEADEVEVPEGYSGDTGGDEEEEAEEEEQGGYGGRFMPIDPPSKTYAARVESSLDEEISGRSDREQQSSGSSGDRRRRGVLEEIDSDEFFLRARGISGDDVNVGRFIATEIRDAFRSTGANALADLRADLDGAPPARPLRTRSLRKRREREAPTGPTGPPGPPGGGPPPRPKRDRRHSGESARVDEGEGRGESGRTGSVSGSRHRVIYQTEGVPGGPEPLDDIVVVKPARRKSRSVARSRSDSGSAALVPPPPVAPRRRKRGRVRDPGGNPVDLDAARRTLCNGHTRPTDWSEGVEFSPEVHDDLENQNPEDRLQSVVARLEHDYIEPAPIAPKRRSRSRGTSVADDDRTSRGAESLPELGYPEEEEEGEEEEEAGAGGPGDTESLPGYAVVEKREKPPRPPPPRRRREKFGGPAVPVRPRRAYSTLGPSRRRSASPEEEDKMAERTDVTPYTELDSDEPDSHDAQGGGKDLDKIQGRPLPAPPRPPRARREAATDGVAEVAEVAAATQTDPLPDDVVLIEEEVTSAKLVVAPSRTGSQILVSSERIATPTFGRSSPAVPPLPRSLRRDGAPTSGRIPTPEYESDEEEAGMEEGPADGVPPASLASALPLGEERLRIASLEVADLRVERLNVSQLEAHKISASEVDAVMVSASEISNNSVAEETASIHPSLLKELIAIRNHLEQVASSPRLRERSPEIERRRSPDKGEGELLSPVDRLIAELRRSDGTGGEESEPPETGDTLTLTSPESEDSARPDVRTEDSVEGETRAEVRSGDDVGKPLIETTRLAGDVPAAKESEPIETRDATAAEISEIPDAVTTASSAHRESPVPPTTPGLSAPAGHPAPKTGGNESLGKDEDKGDKRKPSRSRSSSPSKDGKRPVRQTASPVRSLPPLISVTPDRSDPLPCPVPEVQVLPQRAIVSYVQNGEEEVLQRPTVGATRFVAFPTSQIPADFFSLASPLSSGLEPEPTVAESTQQLMRAMRIAGTRAMRHFVGYVSSRVSVEDRGEKTKEIELALCALLLLIAGLLILCFGSPRTVTHHHHWDYFNPPQ